MDECKQGYILVVGSAYGENVLQLKSKMIAGQKHNIVCHELLGGSGLDYTLRLINASIPAFPILPLGSDKLGHYIQEEIIASVKRTELPKQLLQFVNSEDFFVPNAATARSFNLVEKDRRTSFVEQARGNLKFKDFVKQRLENLATYEDININSVMIGNINSDSPDLNPSKPGECTSYLIQQFYNKSLIFCNFGNSQICMGANFWEESLKHISVLQLNLHEVRGLLAQKDEKFSLVDIIEWFKERSITAVITLDKFGAIGSYKSGKDGVILAWPYESINTIDTTGAGDAFGAGLISVLSRNADFHFRDFYRAIKEASLWAAYACTTLGGASNCPSGSILNSYKKNITAQGLHYIEVEDAGKMKRILQLLDKAY